MKKRRPAASTLVLDEPSRTGHHCPTTGWWSAVGDPSDARFIIKGEVMPALSGTPAFWALTGAAGGVQGLRLESALQPTS
ncbi:hypothetical protein [Arthrobacter rhizosphaerae]|uniref:hypothetical protein n=1 Tax=Arthrobacter rhizosphaerae TaxID=2855490 RepID=UPI001FF3B06E|nr:hypothetical protein [Arthrobacter rhizosphaerae]